MFENKNKNSDGELLRWAKPQMNPNEYQELLDSREKNPKFYMDFIDILRGKRETEDNQGNSKPNGRRPSKTGSTPHQNTQDNLKGRREFSLEKKKILDGIAKKRVSHRRYTKKIIPFEVAAKAEDEKIYKMKTDIEVASLRVANMANRKEEMLEKAKYVCSTYPKTLSENRVLIQACANQQDKEVLQSEYELMFKELEEMRTMKARLDRKVSKFFGGLKIVVSTIFTGSSNMTTLQEIKKNAGGY